MRRLAGLATLIMLAAAPAYGAAPGMEVTAAWDGRYLPGAGTELAVRITSFSGLDARVAATTASGTYATRVSTRADTPTTVHIPLAAPGHGTVDITVSAAGQPVVQKQLRLRPVDGPLHVLAVSAPSLADADARVFRAGAASLPVFAAGYDIVGALVIDGDTLSALDTRQLAALQAFSADCGSIGLVAASPAVVEALRATAGCGAAHLASLATAADIASFFEGARPAPSLPSAAAVGELFTGGGSTAATTVLVALVALSVIAIAVLARAGVPLAGLLGVPLAGTALVATAATALDVTRLSATYADMISGDRSARFVRIVRLEGGGPASVTVPVDPGWLRPLGGSDLDVLAEGPYFERPSVSMDMALLARRDLVVTGAQPFEHPLRLNVRSGLAHIVNAGDAPVAGALLAWRDTEYALPTIAPGATVTADPDWPTAGHGAARRLLRARSAPGVPALIAPLNPASRHASDWVLIRPGSRTSP